MKIIVNRFIPFKGFAAMYFFGLLFVRKGARVGERMIRHEAIHHEQAKEMLFIFFYLWYVVEWLLRLLLQPFTGKNAYRNISLEREAYAKQRYVGYTDTRKHFHWLRYIFTKPV
ncbi:MAG: hypothetical protein J6B41_07380 [Alistipes sp.]|nr:hypothetical protein [Alistipes sp.]